MARYAIAVDLGTSGYRAQALELDSGQIHSTALAARSPMPGGNAMDQLHFALERGPEAARARVQSGLNQLFGALQIPLEEVERLAVCGNPAQLSFFQGAESRDLAFSGARKLEAMGVAPPDRRARVVPAESLPGLALPPRCEVIIPPAVRHAVGADALALIEQSGMRSRPEISLAIDVGTNAELALLHQGTTRTGSAAAGPALEGQHVTFGMLAAPGALADLQPAAGRHRMLVLDDDMLPAPGPLVVLSRPGFAGGERARRPVAVTGTGTLALVDQALQAHLIALPHITTFDSRLHLGDRIFFTEEDLLEVGKAVGALRAGVLSLCEAAGIGPGDIESVYLSGASGTFVDALKAQRLGIVPPRARTVFHIGNTSLALARRLARAPQLLGPLNELAGELAQTHCMFAASPAFKSAFILELSLWTEGMPLSRYRSLLRRFHLPDLEELRPPEAVVHWAHRDIDDWGRAGLFRLPTGGSAPRPGAHSERSEADSRVPSTPLEATGPGRESGRARE